MFGRRRRFNKPAAIMAIPSVFFLLLSIFGFSAPAQATSIPGAGFEDGTLTGWSIGTQTGNLGASINGNGTGVTVFSGSRLFSHGSHGSMGSPTVNGQPNPYYAPAVAAGTWNFSPKGGTYAVAIQPKSQQTFSQATAALGLSGTQTSAITTMLSGQASASGYGSGTPTDAAWITREVQLTAGVTYTMSWNYMATDYIPYNDGSITSLVPVTVTGTPVITVNNFVQSYALLGFTNPGTGDYSTNSYGSTGWQTSTYEVSITGTYKMGFVAFNLDDTALSPVLMVDDEIGTTLSCNQAGGSCVTFGGVEPNNETAPTVAPTTTAETTTTSSTTTTTLPPAPTSLVVTSLDDTTANGTLRWAITQANANNGGIYDSITFDTNGTISLASSLPSIVGTLTITGNGRTNTIIDGNNAYRPFYVGQGNSITVSNMTLKKGLNGDGGLIFNTKGTVSATNVRFTGMPGGTAVFNKEAGSVSTYTNSTFDYLNVGISADHGSTPSLSTGETTWESQQDSVFQNRTYVNNCVFDNNNSGIDSQRFVKVDNSTFTNNSYAVNVQGWNRSQVIDSSFSNNGIGVYHNSWINTGTNMGTNLRLIDGNTFTNNGISIYLDDTYTDGHKNQNWATVSNNSWDANGVWIRYYQWNGTTNAQGTARPYTTGTVFTQSLNTFPNTIGAPSNLTATDTGTAIVLSWTAPSSGGYLPERYAIGLNTAGQNGWGIPTGNVGGANSLNTTYTINYSVLEELMPSGTTWLFHVRSDNDTFGKYSANSNVLSIQVGASATTTSTVPVAPPVEEVPTGTSLPETPVTPITVTPLPEIPGPIEVDTTIPPAAIETDPIPLPDSTGPIDEPIIVPEIPDAGEPITTGDLTDILDTTFTPDASTEEITAVLDGLLDTELTGKQFDAVIDATLGSLDGPDADVGAVLDTFLDADLSDKEFTKVLDAVFSEDVSDGVFTEALTTMLDADLSAAEFDKVLDAAFSETTSPDAMVSALGAIFDGPASDADISRIMDAVFDEDISVADAGAVLGDLLSGDLSGESLTAVFDSVFDGDLSAGDTVALVEEIFSEPLSAEEFGTVINAIFDEKVSDEILVGTFSAVLDTPLTEERFAEVVNVLENASITSDQVSQVVDLIVGQEGGVESSQATELATSAKVLESINGEQAVAVFAAIVVSEVSAESGAAISEALISAPVEVKESFEEEINVFAGVFDTYEPLGSTINVGQRRSVIAVNLVTSTVAIAAAAGGIPTPGSSPSSPSGPRQDVAARREDEEAEEGGAIEGEGPEWIKRISIYKYKDGVKVMDWKNFTRKFVYGVMASGFTLAGATVMYFTLSGLTQQIALWGTVLAFSASMYLHMKEPDSE